MNATITNTYETLLPLLIAMPRLHQAVCTKLIGSDEPVSARVLGAYVNRSRSWVVKLAMPEIRKALADVAEISILPGAGGGYSLRLLTEDERASRREQAKAKPVPKQPPTVPVDEPEAEASAPDDSATEVHSGGSMGSRAPHWYVLPWVATVDLHKIAAVNTEQGTGVVQLHKGGFIRSPRRTDADQIAAALIDALTKVEGVRVTVYGRD